MTANTLLVFRLGTFNRWRPWCRIWYSDKPIWRPQRSNERNHAMMGVCPNHWRRIWWSGPARRRASRERDTHHDWARRPNKTRLHRRTNCRSTSRVPLERDRYRAAFYGPQSVPLSRCTSCTGRGDDWSASSVASPVKRESTGQDSR